MGQNSEAIVLKGMDYRDADRILKLLTLEHGKASAMARGVRREKSSMKGAVEAITLGIYHLNPGRNMFTISQAEIICSFPKIKGALESLMAVAFVIDLVDSFMEEGHPDEETYQLLKTCLNKMEEDVRFWREIILYFEINLHRINGILPDIYECASCGSKSAGKWVGVNSNESSIVCEKCSKMKNGVESFRVETLYVVDKASGYSPGDFINEGFEKKNLVEAQRLVSLFTRAYLGVELKSRKAIEKYLTKGKMGQ